ncbi:LysR family transcriptional regulator [Sphaerochaeta sp. PS]|uniref:LysR family transcriptional regulator n=1 Tax=Sphaerochaeta sp. PS TaxID=3076336 RepID=UPI0028A38445|nr:LysR family transcriptional regulator [Sphaerochaeta sp. PS]MDT4763132.1 LysR family transcriptional regulator [Sphaerochaeta sp. PS]
MTIRDLRIFSEVANTLSMSETAKRLDCAQPTVSQVIAGLESAYGVRLFERLSRRLFLTPDGSYLLSYAQTILSLYDEVDANLGSYTQGVTLKVGATITVGNTIMAEVVSLFEKENPHILVELYVDNTQTIEEMLLASRLDLALVEGRVHDPSLVSTPILHDTLIVVASPQFPLAGRVRTSDLEGLPFVLREQGSGTREVFVQHLQARGVTIREKWVCHSSDAILSAVRMAQGLTVLSRRLVDRDIEEGLLRVIELEGVTFSRLFSLVYHKDKFFTPQLSLFVESLKLLQEKET